jgi:DNA-binding PucR family transcriptional regulator
MVGRRAAFELSEAAKPLLVHRNTIRCRVTRFAALSGLNIDQTSDFILAWWLIN